MLSGEASTRRECAARSRIVEGDMRRIDDAGRWRRLVIAAVVLLSAAFVTQAHPSPAGASTGRRTA